MDLIEYKIHKVNQSAEQAGLDALLSQLTANRPLCPRQVLGVRIGLAGASALELEAPREDKRLLVIAETDGCFLDGLEVATGAAPGRRTLRIVDYGKVAASFADLKTGRAVRVSPHPDIRQRAIQYTPGETRRYYAMLQGYQVIPDEELLSIQEIELHPPVEILLSHAGVRTTCYVCGEEIINQREVVRGGVPMCRSCAGEGYYQTHR
jgi:formylmethanofuran dehydrogenase subunit E